MKERPILFSAPMVRALMAGKKTQTRREVKDRHLLGGPPVEELLKLCPYGQPGDRLWVKETFFDVRPWRHAPIFAGVTGDFIYRAEYEYREQRRQGKVIGCHPWRPSIFMRRVESRLMLELVSVRVERLQEITREDAVAEGVFFDVYLEGYTADGEAGCFHVSDPRIAYAKLWEKLNGAGSWAANPWVWVLEFKRVEARS